MRQIIAEDRYQETSTHTIAKRAGVGVGTIYEYFAGKEDILLALLEYETAAVWKRIETRIPAWRKMDPLHALENFSLLMVAIANENRGLAKVVLAQVPGALTKDPIIRIVAKGELLLQLLLGGDSRLSESYRTETNTFIFLNALIGVLLGIANGPPATVTDQAIASQISRIFMLVMENQDAIL